MKSPLLTLFPGRRRPTLLHCQSRQAGRCHPIVFALVLALLGLPALAQNPRPRFEIGGMLGTIAGGSGGVSGNAGGGVRAVFNVFGRENRLDLSLETEVNGFAIDSKPSLTSGGRILQGLAGIKTGVAGDRFGAFFKIRPGLVNFGNAIRELEFNSNFPFSPNPLTVRSGSRTLPILDIGGVVEAYPAKHWTIRIDAGDTRIFYDSTSIEGIAISGQPRDNFQFSTGIQYRF